VDDFHVGVRELDSDVTATHMQAGANPVPNSLYSGCKSAADSLAWNQKAAGASPAILTKKRFFISKLPYLKGSSFVTINQWWSGVHTGLRSRHLKAHLFAWDDRRFESLQLNMKK
jgi:hypothetical protein